MLPQKQAAGNTGSGDPSVCFGTILNFWKQATINLLGCRILICKMKELEKKVTENPLVLMILLDPGHRGYIQLQSLKLPCDGCPCGAGSRAPGLVAVGMQLA